PTATVNSTTAATAQAPTTGGAPTQPSGGATTQAASNPTLPADAAPDIKAGTQLRIGFAFATSGGNAVYGKSQRAAAELAVREIMSSTGGLAIIPLFEDTAGQPDQAVTVFQKLSNVDVVDVLIGPTLSNEAKSSDPIAQRLGVPVLAVSNTAGGITDIGDYIFRDSLAESQVIPQTIKIAKEKLNITKVDLLYAKDDAFSKSGADVFRTELGKNGIQIISEQTFGKDDTDFKSQLTAIKADNPDAIVVSALAKPAQSILQQARNDIGIDPKVHIIGGNGFNSPAVLKGAGTAAEGLIVGAAWNSSSDDPLSKDFIKKFTEANGSPPDQFAAQAYAGVKIAYDAAKRANFAGKPLREARTAIRDALKSTGNIPTVLGTFSFTDKRDANHAPVVQIVKDGKFDVLK
ncbi:MAG: ABC transporter substrate-binding protein, partial [Chloroflexota bacterium]|nr:ABC transporter substrate-binding protein [Chloroflexota bacterium]